MTPGAVYKLRVDLWSTANVFLAGHRLRLEVASSSFPGSTAIPTPRQPGGRGQGRRRHERHLPRPDHPSALILPVLP